ncbi:MAG: hypothetical protein MRJ65_12115 [Candidatus Brocadiaceae bacterium]|nr:hypothetical protein [Candidatus Brocadiaceae bacterium]
MEHVEFIKDNRETLAIILKKNFSTEGIMFFTPDDFSQQLAYMKRPKGYHIEPHIHNLVQREVHYTQEVLFVRRGKVKIDFYTKDKIHLGYRVLEEGDVILLASGGHGFTMLESAEMIEVKQGPYVGGLDKTRFEGRQ